MSIISSLLNKARPGVTGTSSAAPSSQGVNRDPASSEQTGISGQAGPPPLSPAAPPAWTLLDGDFHLQTLNLDSVNAGLLEMIPQPPANVLDVGCFCGGNGRWLRAKFPECRLTGIELLEKAAAIASKDYHRVIPKRFEDVDFELDGLASGSFDAIIAADVLEHLYNPWQALLRLKPLASPSGALYASIPNVRNLRVIQTLAKGFWPYEGAGIKDVTHLRFFTQAEVLKMFRETGWKVDALEFRLDPSLLPLTEGRDLSSISALELDGLTLTKLSQDDLMEFLTIQFLLRASPA